MALVGSIAPTKVGAKVLDKFDGTGAGSLSFDANNVIDSTGFTVGDRVEMADTGMSFRWTNPTNTGATPLALRGSTCQYLQRAIKNTVVFTSGLFGLLDATAGTITLPAASGTNSFLASGVSLKSGTGNAGLTVLGHMLTQGWAQVTVANGVAINPGSLLMTDATGQGIVFASPATTDVAYGLAQSVDTAVRTGNAGLTVQALVQLVLFREHFIT